MDALPEDSEDPDLCLPSSKRLLLGRVSDVSRPTMGFAQPTKSKAKVGGLLTFFGDSHLMTIAPTGAGKGRGVIIPNLLSYDGPIVTIDPKAELFDVTAGRRSDLGDRVLLLDPFRKRPHTPTARLNPFDLLSLPGAIVESDAQSLTTLLAAGHDFSTDAYWNDMANQLVTAVIVHFATGEPPERRTLPKVRDLLFNGFFEDEIYRWLEDGRVVNPLARSSLEAYLQIPSDKTRPSVLSTARSYFGPLQGPGVDEMLSESTISLDDVIAGTPQTIYILIPPDKLHSHRLLLQLITTTLLTAVMRRETMPERQTLFLLDEAAQLGHLPALMQAQTLLRAYGLQVWSFWQNAAQIRGLYPDWETLQSNCAVLQVFGITHRSTAEKVSAMIGVSVDDIESLGADEQYLSIAGCLPKRCRRLDYLRDAQFQGLYRANPRFGTRRLPPQADDDRPEPNGP